MRLTMTTAALLAALLVPGTAAFGVSKTNGAYVSQVRSTTCKSRSSSSSSWHLTQRRLHGVSAFAKKRKVNKDDEEKEEEEDTREGMSEAFKSLDALSPDDLLSLDDDAETAQQRPTPSSKSEASSSSSVDFDGTPEEEIAMYKEMYQEMESEGDGGMYDAIREEMGGGSSSGSAEAGAEAEAAPAKAQSGILDDADGIGTVEDKGEKLTIETVLSEASAGGGGGDDDKPGIVGETDMEKFMEDAIEEALEEARAQSPDVVPESIRDDEELMKEINDIFDRANEKLIESVKEIELEQNTEAQKGADERADFVKESEARLAEAEESVTRLMAKVAKETAEVEGAMADLKAAQAQVDSNPLSKLTSLKDGGIVKQGTFVGMVLFSIRALTEVAMIAGPDGSSHTTAAAVQGVVALACAAGYFLL